MTDIDARYPLVSCIMPTFNRREFVPLAIKYFLRQDYPNRELIIIDDGTDNIGDLVPNNKQIRYFRLNEKITLGAKLNMACERARGPIIAHWDDDDWYAARRLTYQVKTLLQNGTALCGINKLLYYDLRTRNAYQYIYPSDQRLWLLGSALCYEKELWAGNHFREIDVGMDGLFVWATDPDRITVHDDSTFSLFMIHDHNISPKKTEGPWWHPYSVEKIQHLLDSDWNFYQTDHSQTTFKTHRTTSANDRKTEKSVKAIRNIFACLVHESQECVVDLVRNLRYHDPSSIILLYNGGKDSKLLNDHFPFERYGAILHPSPRPMTWGNLHNFALDCMQFALENFPFDTMTIVDSDQLAVSSGYSQYLAQSISGRSGIGMLGNAPGPQPQNSTVSPVIQALKEIDLWRPFLRRFSEGEDKFFHWTFWPSTVFTAESARDLIRIFSTDKQLQEIMRQSKIWATEEVVLPTLTALLGYDIAANPCSYEYVRYKESYSLHQIEAGFNKSDVFWIHPIERRYDDRIRNHIRVRFNHYERAVFSDCETSKLKANTKTGLLLAKPIMTLMNKVEGWLEEDEADLLMASCHKVLADIPHTNSIVEIGSYCGRSTIVLGSVVKAVNPEAKVYAIDPHSGRVGALDNGIMKEEPTLERFRHNIAAAGLNENVEIIKKHSFEVAWNKGISLLLIDGLHDYVNVSRDFFHFEPWIIDRGYILFHDYADYYPGVKAFVNEILASGRFREILCVNSMIAVQKLHDAETHPGVRPLVQIHHK